MGQLAANRDFQRLWLAQAGSAVGSRVTRTALPVIAILTLKASPTEVAILGALGFAPGVIMALFVGGMVDRSRKRPLMVAADLVRAVLILTIPAAAAAGLLGMGQLYAVAAVVGAASTLFEIADRSFLPVLVKDDALVAANARLEATEAVAEGGGPGLAGVLIQYLTAPVAMALDGLSYIWSAALLLRIEVAETPAAAAEEQRPPLLSDILIGVRACFADPVVGPLLLATAVRYLFAGFFLALYMVLALQTLALSPAVVGLIISVGGLGAFSGALLAPVMARWFGAGPSMVVCNALGSAAGLLVALAHEAPALAIPFLVAQQLLGDAFLGAFSIQAVSQRQLALPQTVLGRANAAFHVAMGLVLLGALVAGPLAEAIGVRASVWIGAAGGLATIPFTLRPAFFRLR